MTPISHCRARMPWRPVPAIPLAILLLPVMAGCTQMQTLKRKIGHVFGPNKPEVTVTHAPAASRSAPAPVVDTTPAPPLKEIVSEQLQRGHYAEGKRQLHRYLEQHPDDRAARDLWRQLTVNPDKVLGSRSHIHVVQAGESYSSLAARYLGDSDRFLILARYNGASDPSRLQVGQHIRLPSASGPATSSADAASLTTSDGADVGSTKSGTAAAGTGSEKNAEALQKQSVALLDQGHQRQALNRLSQALDMDPKLKSSGAQADDLRKQLLSSYHQRAIVLYRDQKLSQAIALWDKILAIDPNYQPAIFYRTRARELQSRLKQL